MAQGRWERDKGTTGQGHGGRERDKGTWEGTTGTGRREHCPIRIQMMTGTAAATFPISSSVCMIFLIRAGGNRALYFFFLLGIAADQAPGPSNCWEPRNRGGSQRGEGHCRAGEIEGGSRRGGV